MHYIANTNRQLRHRLTTSVMYVLFADRDVAIHAMQCNAMQCNDDYGHRR